MSTKFRNPLVLAAVLVFALAGTAGAARLITGKQVKNNSLTGKDIKNRSLKAADLSAKAKAALQGDPGPKGDAGAAGAKGDKGDTGAAGPTAPAGFLGRANSLATDAMHFEYGYVNAVGTGSDDPGDRTLVTPNVALKATDLFVKLSAPPGVGASRSFRLRVNGDDTLLLCLVTGTDTSCSGTNELTIPPRSEVSLTTYSGSGTPADADAVYSLTVERA